MRTEQVVYTAVFTVITAVVLGSVSIAGAQNARYLAHEDTQIAAYVNAATGTPTWVIDVEKLTFAQEGVTLETESDVQSASLDFLTRYREFFGIQPKLLSAPEITTNGRWWFVKYRQVHKGMLVLNAGVGITVDRTGKVIAAGANVYPDISVESTPSLSAAAAASTARSSLERSGQALSEASSLKVLPSKSYEGVDLKLVWQVTLENVDGHTPISKTVLVDAKDGAIIRTIDNIRRSEPAKVNSNSDDQRRKGSFTDDRRLIQIKPASEPGLRQYYTISGYVDLNYYETPDDYYSSLTRHLREGFSGAKVKIVRDSDGWNATTYANASGYYSFSGLQNGSYSVTFFMENQKAYVSSGIGQSAREKSFNVAIVAGSETESYDWNWGDDGDGGLTSYGLNAVNGVNLAYQYFKNTRGYSGMDAVTNPIVVYSSDYGATNGTWIWIGGAEAMSPEVTMHEYTHDVIYRLYGNCFLGSGCGTDPDYNSAEGSAMGEGYADYFTASMTGQSTFGGPVGGADPNYPSGSNGVTVRWLNNSYTMDNWNDWGSSSHRRGQIIAGASWEIRESIGTTADELVWDALQITPQPESFIGMRRNTFAADDAANGGANRADIEQAFVDKKIGGPVEPSYLSVTGDADVGEAYLSWNDRSALEDGYQVQRRHHGPSYSWTTQATLAANSTSYTDDVLCREGKKDYRIRVYKGGLESFSPVRIHDPCGPLSKAGEIAENEGEEPAKSFELHPAYPNPFNPSSLLTYSLSDAMQVKLSVYDVLGREVRVLVNEEQVGGTHEAVFHAEGLPSGLYVVLLVAEDGRSRRTNVLYTK